MGRWTGHVWLTRPLLQGPDPGPRPSSGDSCMAHARHKAPARTPRLDPRRADAVVVLVGAAMLAAAGIGAAAGPPSALTGSRIGVGLDRRRVRWPQPRTRRSPTCAKCAGRSTSGSARGRPTGHRRRPRPWHVAPEVPATTPAYTTIAVNVRAAATEDAAVLAVLDPGAEIAVTGAAAGGYVEIVLATGWPGSTRGTSRPSRPPARQRASAVSRVPPALASSPG